jgi:hypothetical protein
MEEPIIRKYPTEVFCHPFNDGSAEAQKALQKQYCAHINGTCVKPRKSEPHIKVGVCSLGYKGSFTNEFLPVIVCPHRFREDIVFTSIQKKYLSHWTNIHWVSEVTIGVGGNVDYVAVTFDEATKEIRDFLCVEFQAAGTTGSPWQAVLDLKEHGQFKSNSYRYGINWANEFMKTMMQQVYKKGKIIEVWDHKIIFVVQDIAIKYLKRYVDTSLLRPARDEDPIHFCTYKMVWNDTRWELDFDEAVSTDLDGINRILGGADKEHYPTVDDFKRSILRKGKQNGIFI